MKKIFRIALMTAALTGVMGVAQAAEVATAPAPTQDPIVQQLKLSSEQTTKIKALHQQLEDNVAKIPTDNVKNGTLINVIQSGKWDEKAVKAQLAAFSRIEEQARYYRVKYYFDVSQVLTPEQRAEVRSQIAQAMTQ
ncbi:MAG: Spy/CpxP family protein refolding chaperone [Leclercia adecarboxylata]|nr:Spy/CpxP family protein refolding chaperone [uncultured Leclercia sp.]MDU4842579.1 Spy/CpxP family protein refolding chaperone [Leclercia adecarboxylata]